MNEPLNKHTWYEIGGPCDVFCRPARMEDLQKALAICRSDGTPFQVIGKWSNVLVSDDGIRGVVFNLEDCCGQVVVDGLRVRAGAGVQVPKLVLECEKAGLGGIEMFAGIPGTLGGAVKMNAGCHGKEIFDVIEDVTVLRRGSTMTLAKTDIRYSYRHVETLDAPDDVILGATLHLEKADPVVLAHRRKEFMKKRQQTQPIQLPSSGSVFKNPPGDHAARLIDRCGLKGYTVGGASVSDKHANFFVNNGGAKAADVLALISHVRAEVVRQSGIPLELEVQLIGFSANELQQAGLA